ncbi:MAG: flagellar biosynthesis anti-sigma factor FlgM [Sulfuricurvum sp.]
MISSMKGSFSRGIYQEQAPRAKEQEKSSQLLNKQGDTSRIEELKSSIENGTYRVDIEALAKRIAQELT